MPDPKISQTFIRSLNSIERRLLGSLMADYRVYRKDLLDELNRSGLSLDFLTRIVSGADQLKRTSSSLAKESQLEIADVAHRYADRQLNLLRKKGLAPVITPRVIASNDFEIALFSSIDVVRSSLVGTAAQLRLGSDEIDVVGRLLSTQLVDSRASVWRHGRNRLMSDVILAVWSAANGISGTIYDQAGAQSGVTYGRQAIAAIDERTTDCCLRVHGQVVGLDKPFHLTGTPRFADYIQSPPFHYSCRTVEALHHEAMEAIGVPTSEMRAAARSERDARKRTGKRQEIHPAHATSRRNK